MVHWNTSGPIWTHIYRVSLPSMHCSVKTQWETLVCCTQMRVISFIDVLPPHIYIWLFLFSLITKCHVSYLKCPWQKHSNLLTHWMIKLDGNPSTPSCSLFSTCCLCAPSFALLLLLLLLPLFALVFGQLQQVLGDLVVGFAALVVGVGGGQGKRI